MIVIRRHSYRFLLLACFFAIALTLPRSRAASPVTATLEFGSNVSVPAMVWYERGFNTNNSGLPNNRLVGTAGGYFALEPYFTNNALLLGPELLEQTITLPASNQISGFRSVAFLCSAMRDVEMIAKIVHTSGDEQTAAFTLPSWASFGPTASFSPGLVEIPDAEYFTGGGLLQSIIVNLTNQAVPVREITLSYANPQDVPRAAFFAFSGHNGSILSPVKLSPLNHDLVVEWSYQQRPLADLAIAGDTVEKFPDRAGAPLKVTFNARNAGSAASTAGFVGFYIQQESPSPGMPVRLGQVPLRGLAPGELETGLVFETQLPADLPDGTYEIRYVLDDTQTTREGSENNTRSWTGLPIRALRGAELTGVLDPPQFNAGPGQTLEGRLVIVNHGDVESQPTAGRISLARLPGTPETSSVLTEVQIPAIPGRSMRSVPFRGIVPAEFTAGSYAIEHWIDPTGALLEADKDNNRDFAWAYSGSQAPDLAIDPASFTVTKLAPGETREISLQIRNFSSIASTSSRVVFYWRKDPADFSESAKTGEAHLPPAESFPPPPPVQFRLTAPAEPGRYAFSAVIDPANTVAEGNEANNIVTWLISVTEQNSLPDLFGYFYVPGTSTPLVPGDERTATVDVSNDGSATSSPAKVTYYLRRYRYFEVLGKTFGKEDRKLGEVNIPTLAPGQRHVVGAPVKIDWKTPSGTYVVQAVLDSNNESIEQNEENNFARSFAFQIDALPLLSLVNENTLAPVAPGSAAALSFAVRNQGFVNANAVEMKFSILREGTPENERIALSSFQRGPIAPGESILVQGDLTIPAEVAPGRYELRGVFSLPDVPEHGSPWALAWPVTIAAGIKPNLTGSAPEIRAGFNEGDNVSLPILVRNEGTAAAPASTARVYLGGNYYDPPEAGVFLREFVVPPLPAGATSSITAEFTIPLGSTTGNKRLAIKLDAPGEVDELEETDNVVISRPFGGMLAVSINGSLTNNVPASGRIAQDGTGRMHFTVPPGQTLLTIRGQGGFFLKHGSAAEPDGFARVLPAGAIETGVSIPNPPSGEWYLTATNNPAETYSVGVAFLVLPERRTGIHVTYLEGPITQVRLLASDGSEFMGILNQRAYPIGAGGEWIGREIEIRWPATAGAVALASNGSNYLVVGTGYRSVSGGGTYQIYGAVFDKDSTVVTPQFIAEVSDVTQVAAESAAGQYLVAWLSRSGVYGTLVNATGTIASPGGKLLNATDPQWFNRELRIASNRENYLLGWGADWRSPSPQGKAILVGGDGSVFKPEFQANSAPRSRNLQLAALGTEYLAVWQEPGDDSAENPNGPVYGAAISRDGEILSPGRSLVDHEYAAAPHFLKALGGEPLLTFTTRINGIDALMARRGTSSASFLLPAREIALFPDRAGASQAFFLAQAAREDAALMTWQSGAALLTREAVTSVDLALRTSVAGTIPYPEGAGAMRLDPGFQLIASDNVTLSSAVLTAALTGPGAEQDVLSVLPAAESFLSVTGSNLFNSGVSIGSLSGGTGTNTPLRVIFNSNATPVAVQEALRSVAFSSSAPPQIFQKGGPVIGGRHAKSISFQLALADGSTSTPAVLRLATPPRFISGSALTVRDFSTAPTGEPFRSIVFSGTPQVEWIWKLNGVEVPPSLTNAFAFSPFLANPAQAGAYTVLLRNEAGAVESGPMVVVPNVPELQGSDSFAGRVSLPANASAFRGTNHQASLEAGEPRHAGKIGGRSLWFSWRAPASGIATFHTKGSSFDTLLAVYAGDALASLADVASDEDQGGFFTSQVQFNALEGVTYAIAIDGLNGAAGFYVLTYDLEVTNDTVPVITTQPESIAVPFGTPAQFFVAATGQGLSYEWFFQGSPVPGATSPSIPIPSVQFSEIGRYSVRIRNNIGRLVESRPVYLETGPSRDALSHDKLGDLLARMPAELLEGDAALNPAQIRGLAAGTPFVSVSAGLPDSKLLSNRDSTSDLGEPRHCGVSGGASQWVGFVAQSDGVLQIDSAGSAIDTVLAIYRGVSATALACDDNGGADGKTSVLQVPVVAGRLYRLAVDGANGARGTIKITWNLLANSSRLSYRLLHDDTGLVFRVSGANLNRVLLHSSPDLRAWTPVYTNVAGQPFEFILPVLSGGKRFFKFAQ